MDLSITKTKGFNRKTDDRISKPPVSLQNKTITRVSGIDELDFKSQQKLDLKIQQALPLERAGMPRLLGLNRKWMREQYFS